MIEIQNSRFKIQNFWIIIIVLVIAAFFRFWQLDQIPPGLYPDVAINGNEAITNPGQVFYPENNGREGLMINLISLSFSIFGISVLSIKIVAAFFGTLTVLGTYLLTKELFSIPKPQTTNHKSQTNPKLQNTNSKHFGIWNLEFGISRSDFIALLAAFFVATSFWHVNFSRIGFRAILLPFILVFSFYFLFRGFRTKKLLDFAIAGILFGLGFYTYTSFRMAIFLLPLPILYFWFSNNNLSIPKKLFFIFYFLFFIFITALPIGIYFLQNPKYFISRAAPISIFAQENPLTAFAESFIRHIAMFNIYGDPNWRHNLAGSPQLLWPVGILFLIGIAVTLKEILINALSFIRSWRTKTFQHSIECWNIFVHLFLISWMIILLLPGALTYEGLPHALRTIGVIPVPYIFAAIGGYKLWQWLCQKNIHKKLLLFFVLFFLFTIAFAEYNKYFIVWGQNKNVEGAFTKYYVEIGNYLNSLPENTRKYVIINEPGVPVPFPDGLPMPSQTVMFMEWTHPEKPQSVYLRPEELDRIPFQPNTIIVPMRYDESLFADLSQKFPKGKIQKVNGIAVFNAGP